MPPEKKKRWQLERRVNVGDVVAVIVAISCLFAWEYGQTGDIRENTTKVKYLEEQVQLIRIEIREVNRKADEIKTLLINKK